MINTLTSNQLFFGKVDVSLSPSQLPDVDVRNSAILMNVSGSTLYLGSSSVNTASGLPLAPNTTIIMPFQNLSMLYCICASGTNSELRWMVS